MPKPATKPVNTQTGLIELRQLDLLFCDIRVSIFLMFIKSLRVGLIGLTLFTASAWAANSVVQGVVKGANGHPIQGADIRIETKNGAQLLQTVKTDVNGRYVSGALPAGNYRVTLVVNGAVKTAINNTTIEAGERTELNFDLAKTSASQPPRTAKKGKHWVWIPAFTGSRLPGRWIEIDDNGSWAAEASALNIVRVSGEELQRTVHTV
jgi:hypothetical protein